MRGQVNWLSGFSEESARSMTLTPGEKLNFEWSGYHNVDPAFLWIAK